MRHQDIIAQLYQLTDRSEAIYTVTMQDVLSAIARRMGDDALTLTLEDLQLAREEVKEAIDHNLDIREYIDMGLDSFEIVRSL